VIALGDILRHSSSTWGTRIHYFGRNLFNLFYTVNNFKWGARGSVVVEALMLQAGRSRDRDPMR
jgi:hypothetical protein